MRAAAQNTHVHSAAWETFLVASEVQSARARVLSLPRWPRRCISSPTCAEDILATWAVDPILWKPTKEVWTV